MEILFIRHGHAEHLLEYPNRLNTLHPGLTEYGKSQINQLREQITIHFKDLILVSPTKRTIETASLLTNNKFIITPLIGPRMFPQHPDFPFLDCDQIYTKAELSDQYKSIEIQDLDLECWGEGIYRIDQDISEDYARLLIEWIGDKHDRVIMISHDGTITNFRILLGEESLTRDDFLGEAGIYSMTL